MLAVFTYPSWLADALVFLEGDETAGSSILAGMVQTYIGDCGLAPLTAKPQSTITRPLYSPFCDRDATLPSVKAG